MLQRFKWVIYFAFIGLVLFFGFYIMPRMTNDQEYENYILHIPEQAPDSTGYPLMLFLHGSGERGTDIELVKKHGPPSFVNEDSDFPFVLLAPQCKEGDRWSSWTLIRLIEEIEEKVNIDTNRIYVTGLSMGGQGTWHIAQALPEKFAAIAPICGGSRRDLSDIQLIKDIPVWAFHGEEDEVVPLYQTTRLVEALEELNADVTLTVYPNTGHDSWTETYNNPDLYTWFLSHTRKEQ